MSSMWPDRSLIYPDAIDVDVGTSRLVDTEQQLIPNLQCIGHVPLAHY